MLFCVASPFRVRNRHRRTQRRAPVQMHLPFLDVPVPEARVWDALAGTQRALVKRAIALGWQQEQITILDEDLGVSADGIATRAGFAQLTADVALLKVGIVVGLEGSRPARTNADRGGP